MSRPPDRISLYTALSPSFSSPRLEPYRQAGDDDMEVLSKYVWNICLSEALYLVIQNLEIGLRNALHNAATKTFNSPLWFQKRNLLLASEESQVAEAKEKLTRMGRSHDAGRIVAELDFGFWTSLLDSRYEQTIVNQRGFLLEAFRPMPRYLQKRHTLSKRFNDIRKLRNRISHHERILHWNLTQSHTEILEAIGWISSPLQKLTRLIDRFPHVHTAEYRAKLRVDLEELR